MAHDNEASVKLVEDPLATIYPPKSWSPTTYRTPSVGVVGGVDEVVLTIRYPEGEGDAAVKLNEMDDLDGVKVKPEGALGVEQEEGGVYLYTRLEPSEDEFKFEIFPTE